ncbi:hypothetical protein AK830_g10536 [Neonectria ditissima]|uniref:Uncharacterized protein n=1 Tax=Neonectria ditissima TaxID=78410 RepID=A0A0N8H5F5_9HYPO|nr:hypothetical protein AK830_g10536 [Neonectria ditissima]
MKAVESSHLENLVQHRPILILNLTCHGASFIDTLIRRSPGSIVSKHGGKLLPLEIWFQILEMATEDVDTQSYCLVRPRCLENDASGSVLVCEWVEQKKLCGSLDDRWDVETYEDCISQPENVVQYAEEDQPFRLPETFDSATAIRIHKATLSSDIKVLFADITVPDVIAWVEYGNCETCDATRIMCIECSNGRWAADNFIGWGTRDCSVRLLCPLCLGLGYGEESMSQTGVPIEEQDEDYMTDQEYHNWVQTRFKELGYAD